MTLKEVSPSWRKMLLVFFAISSLNLLETSQAAVVWDGLVKITNITTK